MQTRPETPFPSQLEQECRKMITSDTSLADKGGADNTAYGAAIPGGSD